VVPASYLLASEEVIPGNIARNYARMAKDLQEGTHTRQASTTRSRCIG